MKRKLLITAIALFTAMCMHGRESRELKKWDFRLDGQEEWRTLTIPHDFQMEHPWVENATAQGFKDAATGWYKTTLKADESWKGQKVLLDFEGIGMIGDVWFNGVLVGETEYGYLGAEMDITPHIKYDSDNEILVKANTGYGPGSRWYTGGGLYRPVHLLVKNPISVGRHGIYITTPRIEDGEADDQDHYTDELFNVNPKKVHRGFVMAIVRKGTQPSTLRVSSKGYKTRYVELGRE